LPVLVQNIIWKKRRFFTDLIWFSFQTLSTQSNSLGYFLTKTISLVLTAAKYKPFVSTTADELVFGYDDTLVTLAHKFYPRNKRPMSKMGLLNGVSRKKIHQGMKVRVIKFTYKTQCL
jgi:hypothetical protein